MTLRYAYNTNGTGRHRLDDALVLIAEAGYDGVALTLDHHHSTGRSGRRFRLKARAGMS